MGIMKHTPWNVSDPLLEKTSDFCCKNLVGFCGGPWINGYSHSLITSQVPKGRAFVRGRSQWQFSSWKWRSLADVDLLWLQMIWMIGLVSCSTVFIIIHDKDNCNISWYDYDLLDHFLLALAHTHTHIFVLCTFVLYSYNILYLLVHIYLYKSMICRFFPGKPIVGKSQKNCFLRSKWYRRCREGATRATRSWWGWQPFRESSQNEFYANFVSNDTKRWILPK